MDAPLCQLIAQLFQRQVWMFRYQRSDHSLMIS
jgi:hypothetical protein